MDSFITPFEVLLSSHGITISEALVSAMETCTAFRTFATLFIAVRWELTSCHSMDALKLQIPNARLDT